MLKFFRKIRHRLLKEGRLSGYLLYAIGEILLVVIGILIALQINSWNESRKQRIDEAYFLAKLKANLEEDVKSFTEIINDKKLTTQLDTMLMMMQRPNDYERADFGNRIRYVRHFRRLAPVKMTFDNLIATGKIAVLQNQALVEKLFLYYRNLDEMANGVDAALTQLTRETIIPYFLKFDYWDNHDHIGNRRRRLMQNHLFPIQVKKKSIQEFADDPLIINGIQMKIFAVESQRDIYKTLLQEAEAIIELIEMEMRK